MTLREVAEAIGMHESTVSRVTSNKYLLCDRGLYELKYFFGSGVASSAAVAQAAIEGQTRSEVIAERMIARRAAAAKALADDLTSEQQGARNLQLFYRNLLSLKQLKPPATDPDPPELPRSRRRFSSSRPAARPPGVPPRRIARLSPLNCLRPAPPVTSPGSTACGWWRPRGPRKVLPPMAP
jgi:hypothetical protein